MFLNCFLTSKDFLRQQQPRLGNFDVRNRMLKFCGACNGCCFCVASRLIKKFLLKQTLYNNYKERWITCNVDNFWSVQHIKIPPSGNVNWSLRNILAKYFSIIRNYVLSVFSQREYTIYRQNTLSELILPTLLAGLLRWWFLC